MEPTTYDDDDYPMIPLALLTRLEAHYPSRCPKMSYTDREVWFKAGAADLVTTMRARYNVQQRENS